MNTHNNWNDKEYLDKYWNNNSEDTIFNDLKPICDETECDYWPSGRPNCVTYCPLYNK